MRFILSKPAAKMSVGDLFYTLPSETARDSLYSELASLCIEKVTERKEIKKLELFATELKGISNNTEIVVGILIMYEIYLLSKELGFPVSPAGRDCGLCILDVLGVSGIGEREYDSIALSSDIALVGLQKGCGFEMHIAEPVRKHIQRRLNQRFGKYESNNYEWRKICIPPSTVLEEVGKLAKALNEPYNYVDCNTPELLKEVTEYFFESEKEKTPFELKEYTISEMARLFAFYRNKNSRSEDVGFYDVRNYVFFDDFYKEFKSASFDSERAYKLARNWESGEEKRTLMESFKRKNLPDEMIYCYDKLRFMWDAYDCTSIVYMKLLHLYYKSKEKQIGENVQRSRQFHKTT